VVLGTADEVVDVEEMAEDPEIDEPEETGVGEARLPVPPDIVPVPEVPELAVPPVAPGPVPLAVDPEPGVLFPLAVPPPFVLEPCPFNGDSVPSDKPVRVICTPLATIAYAPLLTGAGFSASATRTVGLKFPEVASRRPE
jgi:hypothetical protein